MWILVVFVALSGVLYESNARLQMARRALEMQRASGISVTPLLALLGFARVSHLTSEELFEAIKSNSFYEVKLLLVSGIKPDGVNSAGLSATHFALDSTPTILRILCEFGAPLEVPDPKGDTPLLAAIRRGQPEHVTELLGWNASLTSQGRNGETPLGLAVAQGDLSMVRRLWQSKPAELLRVQRALNNAGLNSMHIAAEKGDPSMVNLLKSIGFDINMRDGAGMTPLMRLVRQPRRAAAESAALELLNSGTDLAARDNLGKTVIDHIQESGTLEWLDLPQLKP